MKTWDIFCRVIDNYGDIGVCWRLARQLVFEYQLEVRLWVDEIAALKQIWPATTLTSNQQLLEGVIVVVWQDEIEPIYIAEVVIEAFACHLPDSYVTLMSQANTPPVWINLEYLSAESWVEGCHQLESMHPQNGLKKTFYFPGFNTKTGGLLREKSVAIFRRKFNQPQNKRTFLEQLGLTDWQSHGLILSLFSYENTALKPLLEACSDWSTPIIILVPEGKTLTSINNLLNIKLKVGNLFSKKSLTLKVIPFLTQTEYDQLLGTCDINFVRGEDSFVRAQWAAKPFIWHIYPQEEDAHLIKLDAFLNIYTDAMPPSLRELITSFSQAWNEGKDCSEDWNRLLSSYSLWNNYNQTWCEKLEEQIDLVSNLVDFCRSKR
jgi:uncharacterized repeat protein (TIGR03837 family)